jgi:hypothetical protein
MAKVEKLNLESSSSNPIKTMAWDDVGADLEQVLNLDESQET